MLTRVVKNRVDQQRHVRSGCMSWVPCLACLRVSYLDSAVDRKVPPVAAVGQAVTPDPLIVILPSLGGNPLHHGLATQVDLQPLRVVVGAGGPRPSVVADLVDVKPRALGAVIAVPLGRGGQLVVQDLAAFHAKWRFALVRWWSESFGKKENRADQYQHVNG